MNFEVDLVASKIEAVHYLVVGCNTVLLLLVLEGGYNDCVAVLMLCSQYVLVTAEISDWEASSVICVNLGDWFSPNVYFILADGWKGINCEG